MARDLRPRRNTPAPTPVIPEPPHIEVQTVPTRTRGKSLNTLTAAATRLSSRKDIHKMSSQSWQDEAWNMYDIVGEQRFITNTLANKVSQARLFAGRITPGIDDPESLDTGLAVDALNALGDGPTGLSQILKRQAVNLSIAGDGWLAGIPSRLLNPENDIPASPGIDIHDLVWRTFSTQEVTFDLRTDGIKLQVGSGDIIVTTIDDIFLIRIWNPHPRSWWEADSPTRSSLPVLRELVGLTMHISAQIDSRLAGAGVFIVPESAKQAILSRAGIPEDGQDDDPFTDALMEAMITPISDRSNASALVPLVISSPDDVTGKFEHITFSSPLDGEARELREEAIRRLALGQDAPPEVLLGATEISHWGMWLSREETVQSHVEPVLALICDAITTEYLWPVLRGQGMRESEVQEHVIWYDVSHLIARPNKLSEATALFNAGVIDAKALREAGGFDEVDAPQDRNDVTAVVLNMITESPQLASDPGIPVLTEQVRALIAGDTVSATNDVSMPENADTPGIPDTDDSIPRFAGRLAPYREYA